MAPRRYPWQRYLQAHWRDVRVLLRQFYVPLANPRSALIGRHLRDLEYELDFSVLLHRRRGLVDFHPDPDIALETGDRLCMFASLDVLNRLSRPNRPAG